MAREYFLAYHSYLEMFEELSDAEIGRLFKAALEYSATKKISDLRGNEKFLFKVVKIQIDRDSQKYEEKCETNRKNGALGGKTKGEHQVLANGSERFLDLAFAPKEKGKEKEKEKVKVNTKESIANAIPKKKFGEFSNVLLTSEEFDKLKSRFNADCERYIERLSNYVESTGKRYKSHYATILNWAAKDAQNSKSGGESYGNSRQNPQKKLCTEYPE